MTVDRVSGVALALFAVIVLVESRRLPLGSLANPGPAYVPVLLAVFLFLSGIAVAALGAGAPAIGTLTWTEWRHTVAIFAACAFCALGLERLGYRVTIFLALLFLLGVVERKRPLPTLLFAVAVAAGTFFLFDTLLRVPLPRGSLGL